MFLYCTLFEESFGDGCTIVTEISPVSGVMARIGRVVGVVRQNRSVLLHIWGSIWGLIWRSNFEGPDVGVLEESNNPFGTVLTMW
jgi:hypothetical protein